ncbi:hypothetical protein Droror1_Dr00004302 [Drosera rotundifolia]
MILNGVLTHRNEVVHGAKTKPARLIHQHDQALSSSARLGTRRTDEASRVWKAPPMGFIKINVDAGTRVQGVTSLGALARDHTGRLIAAVGSNSTQSLEPAIGEAMALRLGLELARCWSMDNIELESDGRRVVSMIESGKGDLSIAGSVTDDCLLLMRSFSKIRCSGVKREANKVAHVMAFFVSECCQLGSRPEELPMSVRNACNTDFEQRICLQ